MIFFETEVTEAFNSAGNLSILTLFDTIACVQNFNMNRYAASSEITSKKENSICVGTKACSQGYRLYCSIDTRENLYKT